VGDSRDLNETQSECESGNIKVLSESLKGSLCSVDKKGIFVIASCVFDFLQPVVKPTANQMSDTRAISDARANSHLQNKGWSRCEEHNSFGCS